MIISPHKRNKKAFLTVCLFFAVPFVSLSQNIQHVWMDGNFDEMRSAYNRTHADVWDHYHYAWGVATEAFIAGNARVFEKAEEEINQLIEQTSEMNDSRYSMFLQQEYYLILSLMRARYEQEISAAWAFRSAYRLSQKLQDEYPDFQEAKKSFAIIQLLLGSVPDEYQWMVELLGWEGHAFEGVRLLEDLTSNRHVGVESSLLLTLYYSHLLQEYEKAGHSIAQIRGEKRAVPTLITFSYWHKSGKAEQILDYVPGGNVIPLMEFFYAEALLQQGLYDEAITHYNAYLESYNGSDLITDCRYKIYIAYTLQGNKNAASKYRELLEKGGESRVEADRYAMLQGEKGNSPNLEILSMRLATDGGLYRRATEIASRIQRSYDKLSGFEKLEFDYRQGRLNHLKGYVYAAEKQYLETIQNQGKGKWYFAPNSCIQLAAIYIDKKRWDDAEKYLRKALTYRGHEYKRSIDRKAKAMLSALEEINP